QREPGANRGRRGAARRHRRARAVRRPHRLPPRQRRQLREPRHGHHDARHTSRIKLDFTISETYLYLLRLGLPITATASGLPGRSFEGEITRIDSRVDPVTRSIAVRAELPNEEGLLRPGRCMTVTLRGDVRPTLVVPEEAIVPEQGRVYVFAVHGERAVRHEVQVGKRQPGKVEIVEGLAEGEVVVVEGTQNLRDGTRVQEVGRRPT